MPYSSLAPLPLASRLTALRGLGAARLTALQEAGIETLRDLLWSLPFRYLDRGSLRELASLQETDASWPGEERNLVTVMGRIREIRLAETKVKRLLLTEALLEDRSGTIRLTWFNQPYLIKSLKAGDQLLVYGPLQAGRFGLEFPNPGYELLAKGDQPSANPWQGRFLPLYRRLGPLSSRVRQLILTEALQRAFPDDEWLPPELLHDLPDQLTALKALHQPSDASDYRQLEERSTPAHERLATDELFAFNLGVAIRRAGRLKRKGVSIPTSPELRERLKLFLPFSLTQAQRKVFKEIVDDLRSGRVMHRLLQGDVGSGKTLVAFLSMAMVAETLGQAALLAPTEVLARQHAATFSRLLGQEAENLQLLLGPMKAAEKRVALDRIASGEARYIVGTHALFQEQVNFNRLLLIVVDEQHRFGVRQREALKAKGLDPHWLVMSATPIPRSMALALYGDLDQSILDELPPGRQPITTRLLHPDQSEQAWERLEQALQSGQQAYVVSPAIDPTDETKVRLRDIRAMEELLRRRFQDYRVEMVHGRLPAEDMAYRVEAFVRGEAHILLATTVIEVGVDVPNATVMVVDHAERFGLSQLHQLRGRVGRGTVRSHFLMLSAQDSDRLRILVQTQDGFRIAQKDLELRGPGEFFGVRQSGLPNFQVAELVRHRALFLRCRDAAEQALARGLSEVQQDWLRQEKARLRIADVS